MRTNLLHKQQGVMLLEALVGVLIFSIGILGMVSMQATAIQNSSSATYRTEASYLANQIIGTMWADKGNLASYALNANATACAAGGAASNYTNVSNWLSNDVVSLPGNTLAASGVQGLNNQIVIGANNLVTVTLCWKSPKDINPHNFVATAQIN
jgi:type IV pilus assembly protein PilV